MKLRIRYENGYQMIDLDEKATADLWVSLSLECDDDMTLEEKEKRIQDAWDEEFNAPEYRNYRKETRHQGDASFRNREGVMEVNTEEAVMRHAKNQQPYTKGMDELEDRLEREYQDKKYRDWICAELKPDAAEMVTAIALEGMTVGEYAAKIGDTANNVSHRYRRALKKLEKVFEKTSF